MRELTTQQNAHEPFSLNSYLPSIHPFVFKFFFPFISLILLKIILPNLIIYFIHRYLLQRTYIFKNPNPLPLSEKKKKIC